MYHYHPSRLERIPLSILKNYKGYLQTDGYIGYDKIGKEQRIIHISCLAHIRRYFHESWKLNKNKEEIAYIVLEDIKTIYRIGKELKKKGLSNKVFEIERRKLIKPILDKIKKYLIDNRMAVPPKSKIGTAINYALKEWDKLEHYLDKCFLTPDNNFCERSIKPFVIGHKNWYFNVTPEGAHASAAMFSLIQTAEANGLNVDKYLKTVFTKLPLAENEEEIRKLLPTTMKKEDLLM